MRCRECRALLWGYIDRELSDSQQEAIVQHLADCNGCALAHERLRAFPLRPNQMTAVTPPPISPPASCGGLRYSRRPRSWRRCRGRRRAAMGSAG
jgi:hypothetical protein